MVELFLSLHIPWTLCKQHRPTNGVH